MALLRWARLALFVALTTTQFACATINEVVTGRDFECVGGPEDVCLRAAEFAEPLLASDLKELHAPVAVVSAAAIECRRDRPKPSTAVRCWDVAFMTDDGVGVGITVFELVDGSFSGNR